MENHCFWVGAAQKKVVEKERVYLFGFATESKITANVRPKNSS